MIAACLIVKDAEQTIAACLDSIRPFADEINVYDTGSTDGTLELLDGVRVERGEWRDDFGWARQQSFEMASPEHEWLLWIDADETAHGTGDLRSVVEETEADGFFAHLATAGGASVRRVQLVRRSAARWVSSIHEYLDLPKERCEVLDPDTFRVFHHRPPERHESGRNLRMLIDQAKREQQISARTLFFLGSEWLLAGRFEKALQAFEDFLRRTDIEPEWRQRAEDEAALCRFFLGVASCA